MDLEGSVSRRRFVAGVVLGSLSMPGLALPGLALRAEKLTTSDLAAFEKLAGIELSEAERAAVLEDVQQAAQWYEKLRQLPIDYKTEPPTVFTPLGGGTRPGSKVRAVPAKVKTGKLAGEDLAFASIAELHELLKQRKISSVELTQFFISRLKEYGNALLCVVTLLEESALASAQAADKEISAGKMRGPLHGIPCGVKDLFATREGKTTWGAEPYREQQFDEDAAVIERLRAAGVIVVAKLSLGALAMGDVWFGGTTKNPFNTKRGSSGSSAGSAAATAAGLVPFAIGTETLGSICSPSWECRVTGLRPTYGRISRYGAMALSYTMDKVGPITRSAEDCALVFAALCGHDPRDPSSVDQPFAWPVKSKPMRVAVVGKISDVPFADALRQAGHELVAKTFTPAQPLSELILSVESASAFDEFTRGDKIDRLNNSAWPQYFRFARHVPAVEYVQAQRARKLLMLQFEKEFSGFDAIITPDIGGSTLFTTNLSGHPQVIIPWEPRKNGTSHSWSFIGNIYGEDQLLALAQLAQNTADWHRKRPSLPESA